MASVKRGDKKRPARMNYWAFGHLRKNKIRRILKSTRVKTGTTKTVVRPNGLEVIKDVTRPITEQEAVKRWTTSRTRYAGAGSIAE